MSAVTTSQVSFVRRWRRRLLWTTGVVSLVGACFAARQWWNVGAAPAAAEQASAPAENVDQSQATVADVNGQRITRQELANESLRHYGKEVLESVVNRQLIAEHCKLRGIQVLPQEVEEEIDRTASRFSLPRDQWLKMLKEERHITAVQYAEDIVWPTIALRKLAAERIEPSEEDVQKAYESQFGETVQVRVIVCGTREKAQQVYAAAVQQPEKFPDLAKEFSEDPSAAAKGMIQPVRKHVGHPVVEATAFALQPGQISEVIQVEHQFVIMKCDSHFPPQRVPLDEVHAALKDSVRDKKLRQVAEQVFVELQQASKVENVFTDPVRSQQQPGVAAIIDGRPLSTEVLAEECVKRHGTQVLEGMISRTIIDQACRQKNIQIGEEDLNAEIAHAARAMGHETADGQPDVQAWLKEATEGQNLSLEVYRHDIVWPSVALRKLVFDSIEITQDDLHKGFEANYGERVRCRAIVFNQLRKAQEVFELARERPTIEHFGDLAEQFSVEAGSRVLRGEVPPIQKFGGQPSLEKEAFSLEAGQLSSIVQVGDKFVLLFCEGRTTPTPVKFEEVRDRIETEVREKKTQVAMTQHFQALQDASRIDNYLAGTSQRPPEQKGPQGSSIETARTGSNLQR